MWWKESNCASSYSLRKICKFQVRRISCTVVILRELPYLVFYLINLIWKLFEIIIFLFYLYFQFHFWKPIKKVQGFLVFKSRKIFELFSSEKINCENILSWKSWPWVESILTSLSTNCLYWIWILSSGSCPSQVGILQCHFCPNVLFVLQWEYKLK